MTALPTSKAKWWNHDFFPIVGEYNRDRSKFVLNIMSFVDANVILSSSACEFHDHQVQLQAHTSSRKELDASPPGTTTTVTFFYGNEEESLSFDVPPSSASASSSNNFPTVNVYNCDCQHIADVGMWHRQEAKSAPFSFHIGDQIYLDLFFKRHASQIDKEHQQLSDAKIREEVYKEYRRAFIRKAHVLQGSFNVMLGDDHDVVDESIRKDYDATTVERLIELYKKIFFEIQGNLRLDKSSTVVKCGNMTFLLIDNINVPEYHQYMENFTRIAKAYAEGGAGGPRDRNCRDLYVLSPRVPLNFDLPGGWRGFIHKTIYDSKPDTTDYDALYSELFKMVPYQNVHVLCGDAHIAKCFTIAESASTTATRTMQPPPRSHSKLRTIELFLVGAVNSVLDNIPVDLTVEENLAHTPSFICTQDTTRRPPLHSFVTIKNGAPQFVQEPLNDATKKRARVQALQFAYEHKFK